MGDFLGASFSSFQNKFSLAVTKSALLMPYQEAPRSLGQKSDCGREKQRQGNVWIVLSLRLAESGGGGPK